VQVLEEGTDVPDVAKRIATGILAQIARSKEHRGTVIAAGVVMACVRVLDEGPDDAKSNAASVLAQLARSEEHTGAVVAAGAMPACVRVLEEGPEDAKEAAAHTLSNVAYIQEYRGAVVAAGGVPACAQMLKEWQEGTYGRFAALTLLHITRSEKHLDAVIAAGAVPACVRVLEKGPDENKMCAARTLAHIALSEEHRGAVVAAGTVPVCIGIMAQSTETDLEVALVLGAIAMSATHANLVAGVAAVCVQALDNPKSVCIQKLKTRFGVDFEPAYEALVQLMGPVTLLQLKELVFAVIDEVGLENLTQKKVYFHVEEKLGLKRRALKCHKAAVSNLIDEYIETYPDR